MRKILVAILCLFFFGACTQKNEGELTEVPENYLELSVRSGGNVTTASMPASVYDLTDLKPNETCEPTNFAADEKISFKDLISGKYTFFVLGNRTEEQYCHVALGGNDMKTMTFEWETYSLPELFGGIVKLDGSKESETVEMTRLVGGVVVNVVNKEEFPHVTIYLHTPYEPDTIRLDDYAIVPRHYNNSLEEGSLCYRFPSSYPIKGEILAYDDNKNEYYFDFESTKFVERNKKLELNITLKRTSSFARSGNSGNTVTCVEKVTEL